GSLSRYSKSTVRRHRRVSHFEVEFAVKLSNKSQKIDVKQQKTLEQLSPELLLGQLGYHLDTGKPK
ncbi:hypothetical protein, partial [Aeromonas hydrophila]